MLKLTVKENLAEVQNKVDRLLPRKTVNLVGGRGRSAMATGQQIVGARMCTVRMRLLSAAVLRPDLRTLNPALPGEAAKQKTDDVLMRCRAYRGPVVQCCSLTREQILTRKHILKIGAHSNEILLQGSSWPYCNAAYLWFWASPTCSSALRPRSSLLWSVCA